MNLRSVRRMDPCGDPEFELHNHIDYARHSCFFGIRLIADKIRFEVQLQEGVTYPGTNTPTVA